MITHPFLLQGVDVIEPNQTKNGEKTENWKRDGLMMLMQADGTIDRSLHSETIDG